MPDTEGKERLDVTKIIVLALIILLIPLFIVRYTKMQYAYLISNAKTTLRSIGSSQLAYQGMNNPKNYGSFQALKDDGYLAKDYTLGNMIENYSMTWQYYVCYEPFNCIFLEGAFTIIAYPRGTRPGYLATFAITEDQKLRKFTPANGNRFNSVKTWDPIL